MSLLRVDQLGTTDDSILINVASLALGQGLINSISTVSTVVVPPTTNLIKTSGYYTAGDGGGASYKRVASEPSHPGKFQTLDGAWWEFCDKEVSLLQMGCVADSVSGSTGSGADNAANFGKARDVAVALGIPITVPAAAPGKAFRLASRVTFPSTVTIKGVGAHVTTGISNDPNALNTPNGGSWLYFDHLDSGLYFRDDSNVGTSRKFARISGIGIDRNQAAPTAGWTPSAAAHDIRVEFNVDLDDVVFLKSSKCAIIRSAGQLQTRRVRGQALVIGFECERSSDVQRWDGDHWWPYWTQNTNVITYTKQNAYAYSLRRADGLYIMNSFAIFYKRHVYAADAVGDGSGLAGFNFTNMYSDIGGGGIEINSNVYPAYGSIDNYLCNSDVGGNGTDGAALKVAGTVASKIKVSMRSNRSPEEVVSVFGAAHTVTLNLVYANGWSYVTPNRYAIKAGDGAVIKLLNMPELTTGNNLFYSKDANSSILFPVTFDLGGAAASSQGFYSRRITIADDGVAVIPAPSNDATTNMSITPLSVPGAGNPAGSVWLRATAAPSAVNINLSTTTGVAIVTGTLNGTTGTDGDLTISAAPDGNYYIENRTGLSRSFILTFLGD